MLKTCSMCREQKPRTAFNRNAIRKDGLQNLCRVCSANRSRISYPSHTEEQRETTRKRRAKKRR